MTTPPMPPPQPVPPAVPAGGDRTTLFGVLGIIGAFCCWPLGVLFSILAYTEARKVGKPPTLAYIAFAVLVIGLIVNIFSWVWYAQR